MEEILTQAQLALSSALVQAKPYADEVLMASGAFFVVLGLWCAALPVRAAGGLGLTIDDAKGAIEFRAQYGGGLIGPGAAAAAAGWAGAPFLLPGLVFFLAYVGGLGALRAFAIAVAPVKVGIMDIFFWIEFVWAAIVAFALAALLFA